MSCRAKISILVILVGVVTAHAAPLDPAQKNSVFQPGAKSAVTKAKVIRPANATKWPKSTLWKDVKVQKIDAVAQTAADVEVSGITFQKTKEAPSALKSAPVSRAGGNR